MIVRFDANKLLATVALVAATLLFGGEELSFAAKPLKSSSNTVEERDIESPKMPVLITLERKGSKTVRVPTGRFLMGCNKRIDPLCFHDEGERPASVFIDEFYIDRHETTVEEYAACVDFGLCSEPDSGGSCNWDREDRRDHPVNCVDWYQAETYCLWAGKRLPTEAEWEKAARGTDGRAYPWGNDGFADDIPVANIADLSAGRANPSWATANRYDDGFAETSPVESFPEGQSPYGAFDMVGNVWEWVNDWYGEFYYEHAPWKNRKGPNDGEFKIVRGGSFFNFPYLNRASYRGWNDPEIRQIYIGIRCAHSEAP